jgi:hypothetical protein
VVEPEEQQQPKRPRRARRLPITLVPLVLLGGLGLAGCPPPAPLVPPAATCTIIANAFSAGTPLIGVTVFVTNPYSRTVTVERQGGGTPLFSAPLSGGDGTPHQIPAGINDDITGWPFIPFYYVTIDGNRACQTSPSATCVLTVSPTSVPQSTDVDVLLLSNQPNAATTYTIDGFPDSGLDGVTDGTGSEPWTFLLSLDPLLSDPLPYALEATVNGTTCAAMLTIT